MEYKLPITIVSPADINRLLRELADLENQAIGAKLKAGSAQQMSGSLQKLTELNKINLRDDKQRDEMRENLETLLHKAPIVHITFASEPTPGALERILSWLRTNVHYQILLKVGLSPSIAAGCVLRTPNKIFDMSMGAYLKKQQDYLVELIHGTASRV